MKFPLLISYAYWNSEVEEWLSKYKKHIHVLLDSGAFTAFTLGKPVDILTYCKFIKKNSHLIDEYIQLDVIGDPQGTIKNLEIMRKQGLNPLPVFTRGHTMEYLHKLKNERFCVGGLVGLPTNDKQHLISGILDQLPMLNKVHLLGVDQPKFFRHRHKPLTMDASNWISAFRFGQISLYINGEEVKFDYKVARDHTGKNYQKIRRYLREELDLHVEEFRERKAWIAQKGSPLYLMTCRASAHRVWWINKMFNRSQFLIYNGDLRTHTALQFALEKGWVE